MISKGWRSLLFSYERTKQLLEESKDDGIVLDIFFNAGSDVPVLTNVLCDWNCGESIDEFIPDDVTPFCALPVRQAKVQPEPRLNDFDFSEKSEPKTQKILVKHRALVR